MIRAIYTVDMIQYLKDTSVDEETKRWHDLIIERLEASESLAKRADDYAAMLDVRSIADNNQAMRREVHAYYSSASLLQTNK